MSARREIQHVLAVDVRVHDLAGADDLDGHAGQGDGVLLVTDSSDDPDSRAVRGRRRGRRGLLCAGWRRREQNRERQAEQAPVQYAAWHTLLGKWAGNASEASLGGCQNERRLPTTHDPPITNLLHGC
jgi:hypothetical protein